MSGTESRSDVALVEASVGVGGRGLASTLSDRRVVPFVPQFVERSRCSWRVLDLSQQLLEGRFGVVSGSVDHSAGLASTSRRWVTSCADSDPVDAGAKFAEMTSSSRHASNVDAREQRESSNAVPRCATAVPHVDQADATTLGNRCEHWWAQTDSNRRHLPCKGRGSSEPQSDHTGFVIAPFSAP